LIVHTWVALALNSLPDLVAKLLEAVATLFNVRATLPDVLAKSLIAWAEPLLVIATRQDLRAMMLDVFIELKPFRIIF